MYIPILLKAWYSMATNVTCTIHIYKIITDHGLVSSVYGFYLIAT